MKQYGDFPTLLTFSTLGEEISQKVSHKVLYVMAQFQFIVKHLGIFTIRGDTKMLYFKLDWNSQHWGRRFRRRFHLLLITCYSDLLGSGKRYNFFLSDKNRISAD